MKPQNNEGTRACERQKMGVVDQSAKYLGCSKKNKCEKGKKDLAVVGTEEKDENVLDVIR